MKSICHISVSTDDVDRLSAFYENYFWAVRDSDYADPETGLVSRFLHFNGQTGLEITANTGGLKPGRRSGSVRIAFSVGSEQEVDSITVDLIKGGNPMIQPPHKTGNGRYESRVADPDGNEITITV